MGKSFILLLLLGILAAGEAQRNFVTAFMENYSRSTETTYQIYLVTYARAASVSVTVANPRFNQTVFIDRDSHALVTLDYQYMVYEKQITSKAVLVTSDADISVFGFYSAPGTADAMECLSAEDLGTEYYIFTSGAGQANQFAVASGIEETVLVNVTVSGSVEYNGLLYGNQDTFSLTLGYQQVVQFQSSKDLTGTRVSSSAPVAVFSGNKCFTGFSILCDTIVEQLYPVQKWGKSFAVFPLLNHTQDNVDIMAANPNTTVNVMGPTRTTQYKLQPGSHIRLSLQERILLDSSKPIMVSYLFQESKPGLANDDYDPFFSTVPPLSLTRKYYKFVTRDTYYNFLFIVSQAASASEFFLDHQPLSFYDFSMTEIGGFKGWEVSLGKVDGQHEIYHESLEFVIHVYGIESYVSFGYSMGQESRYPDPPLPEPTEGPAMPQDLRCLSSGAVYHLPLSFLLDSHLSVYDVHLEDPGCHAVQDGKYAVVRIPFNRCGSKVINENGKTFYVNTVYGTVPETGIHRMEVPVSCEMQPNETLGLRFHPKVTDLVSRGHYNVSLKLYPSEAFNDPIASYPYELDLRGRLYVAFKVESDDEKLQILVESCRSSPSLEDTEQIYNLIQHGCPEDSTVLSHSVSDQRETRFSFHAFKFENSPEVYLSCDVIICRNDASPNRCTRGCATQRRRRDVPSSKVQLGSAQLSQGPIVFRHGDPARNAADNVTLPSSAFITAMGTVGLLSVLLLMLQRYYYKKRGYSLLQNSVN